MSGLVSGLVGIQTQAAQPLVIAYPASTSSNVTGDGGAFTVVFGNEITDQNGDFDGTSTFTAPVTGSYFVAAAIYVAGIASDQVRSYLYFYSSNLNTAGAHGHPYNHADSNGQAGFFDTAIMEMDAGDTLTIPFNVAGGSEVVDIFVDSRISISLMA
jgi:hypothetical protein